MSALDGLTPAQITRRLTYAGFVLLAHELLKSMVVGPIKFFYARTTFGDGPFKTYAEDVASRHENEFEACLLYLRDFMKVIDNDDLIAIQDLRRHRNELAHDLVDRLPSLDPKDHRQLWVRAERALYRLSQHLTIMEIGADPALRRVAWDRVKGHEYLIFEAVVEKVGVLSGEEDGGVPKDNPGGRGCIPLKEFEYEIKPDEPPSA